MKQVEQKRIRQRVRAMIKRWEADVEILESMGIVLDDRERSDPVSETVRNLLTAIAEARSILGMSDYGIAEHVR